MKKLWAKFMLWWLYNDCMSCELGAADHFLDKDDQEYYKNELTKVQARIKHYEGTLNGK